MKVIKDIKHKSAKLGTRIGLSAICLGLAASLMSGVASAASVDVSTDTTSTSTGNTSTSNSTSVNTNSSSANSSTSSTVNKQHLQNIITKGNEEISRRLSTLNTLTSKIKAATKLTASDSTTLTNEVSSSISGLATLKVQLDGATSLSTAITDAGDIYTEYRVYALVAPKVELIKVADDQQAVQAKLTTMAQRLQTRITAEQQAGQNVATLQSDLNNMTSEIAAGQAISSNIESSVINLEPTDYNSNHSVLTGDNTQLKTAHDDDQTALNDAKTIVSSLADMKS